MSHSFRQEMSIRNSHYTVYGPKGSRKKNNGLFFSGPATKRGLE